MKKSNIYLSVVGIVIITGMFITNSILKNEYQKIDITDVYKNYISVETASYSVLHISGSNGYPIEITQHKTDDIKVLRSRLNHFKKTLRNDTLFVEFTGSNIPMQQRYNTDTPAGIIIHKNVLETIISNNTHNRMSGFSNQNLNVTLLGTSLLEMRNSILKTMKIDMRNQSQIAFSEENSIDSLNLKMINTSVASLQKIDFRTIHHALSDSITLVLSNNVFKNILKK